MKDAATKACVGALCITAAYGLYLGLSPAPQDGAMFSAVMAVIGGLVGFSVSTAVKIEKLGG